MDKYEYKLRLEEIRTLNKKGRFQEAAQVADTVDWNKVRNVSTLCVISDVYKINRRFEDAKAMLLLANEKSPQNRRISYALCDLTIKMGQVVEAVEYYKEFVQQAPNDNNRYILLYKIYEAQDISLEERIAVLKEYKKREYNEKWAYELAFLYHRLGLATECIEECDQLILWFGEGKYVVKAMELKQLYAALSPAQQQAYDLMTGRRTDSETEEEPMQEEAEEVLSPVEISESEPAQPAAEDVKAEAPVKKAAEDEVEIQVKPMDMGEYNTINLQAALAESMREVLEPDMPGQETTRLPDTGMRQIYAQSKGKNVGQLEEYGGENAEYLEDVTRVLKGSEDLTSGVTGQLEDEETERILRQVERQAAMKPHQTANLVQNAEDEDNTYNGGNMDNLLSQEYDGQISLALPEEKVVEKQITGQMNIEDVLGEWERIKEANARKRKEETREWMLQQTGSLFAEFDQQSKEGVLEQLERGAAVYEERVRSKQAEKAVKEVQPAEEVLPVEAAENETMQSEVEVQSAADVQPETMILSEEEAQPAAETTTEEAEAEESEVEELEEIEELQEDGWAQDTADIVMDTETVEESPRPVNAAAKAVMAAQGAAAAAAEQEEEEAAVTNAEESEAADGGEDREDKDSGDAAEEQAENSDAETSEAAPADEPAAEEASAESAQAAESPVEEEEEGSAQTGSLEDTAALHARIREEQIQEHMRHMSREEKDMFAPYVPTRGAMRQLVTALDSISLSAFTGNVILTGAPGADTMGLARNMIRSVRASNNNFSGKVAKISGEVLNEKSAADVVAKVAGGALIVEKAGKLSAAGAESLAAALNQEHTGVVVFAMDTKKSMERLMDRCAPLAESFTARFDIASLDSSTLVKYGCQYAYTQEFAIDELGRLALHTRIEDMQTSEHAVTVEEVREIVDEAIEHASRASLRHFWDIILRRRYDEDDMIILRERDFI